MGLLAFTTVTKCDIYISVKLIFALMMAVNGTVELSAEVYSIGPWSNSPDVVNNFNNMGLGSSEEKKEDSVAAQ